MSGSPLTEAWLARRVELGRSLPPVAGATAELLHIVTGGPDGEIRYRETWVDGQLTAGAFGDDGEGALDLLVKHDIALLVARGELHVVDGFMQGRVKLTGPTGTFLALQPALQRPEHDEMVAAAAEALGSA